MLLPPLGLTPSGRPLLFAGEVERMLLDKVDLEFEEGGGGVEGGERADRYKDGYAVLTTQRLMWLEASSTTTTTSTTTTIRRRSCWVALEAVASARRRSQLAFPAPKVRVEVRLYADASRRPIPGGGGGASAVGFLMLRCRGPAPDAFAAALEQAAAAATAAAAAARGAAGPLSHALPRGSLALNPATASLASGSFSQAPGPAMDQLRMAQQQYQQQQQQQQQQQGQQGAGGGGGGGGGGDGGAAVSGRQPLPPPSSFAREPDAAMLRGIVEMGFPRAQGARALLATGNEGVQQALDWILAFGGEEEAGGEEEQQRRGEQGDGDGGAGGASPMQLSARDPSPGGPAAASAADSFPSAGAYAYAPPAIYGVRPAAATAAAAAAAATGGPASSPWLGGGGGRTAAVPPRGAVSSVAALGGGHNSSNHHGYDGGGFFNPLSAGAGMDPASRAAAAAAGPPAPPFLPPPPSSSSGVGVSGILQRQQARTAATGKSMDTAFRDLSALMAAAQEMVALAERFRGVSDGAEGGAPAQGGGGGAGSRAGDPLLIDRETQLQLIALGIASPVTRESAGARYTLELARQLADFMLTPVAQPLAAAAAGGAGAADNNSGAGLLSRAGGVMLLHDVYCLFNRARGVELVSPEDLIAACEAFGRADDGLGGAGGSGGTAGASAATATAAAAAAAAAAPSLSMPIRLRRLPSGVLVLQSTAFSDEELCRRIRELVDYEAEEKEEEGQEEEEEGGQSAAAARKRERERRRKARAPLAAGALGPPLFEADAARALRLPLALAREALRVAEQRGVLCRDEGGAEGLTFYRNFFAEAAETTTI